MGGGHKRGLNLTHLLLKSLGLLQAPFLFSKEREKDFKILMLSNNLEFFFKKF